MLPQRCDDVFLTLFTFLLLMTGLALVVVGWTLNARYYDVMYFLEVFCVAPSTVIAAIGFTIFGVAAIGYYGTYKRSSDPITAYGVCLGILGLALGVFYWYRLQILFTVLDYFGSSINRTMYEYPHNDFAAKRMNAVQIHFNCCGTREAADWIKVFGNHTIPRSCPTNMNVDMFPLHIRGCYDALAGYVNSAWEIATTCSAMLLYMTFIGMICALYSARCLSKKQELCEKTPYPTFPYSFKKCKNDRYYLL